MEWGTIAGVLTAFATLLTAAGGLIVSIKVLIPNFKTNKETHRHAELPGCTDSRTHQAWC
jgi:hypothetical protein